MKIQNLKYHNPHWTLSDKVVCFAWIISIFIGHTALIGLFFVNWLYWPCMCAYTIGLLLMRGLKKSFEPFLIERQPLTRSQELFGEHGFGILLVPFLVKGAGYLIIFFTNKI